jgi:hypothetical protein
MHFLTPLIIVFGSVSVACLGLINVAWQLSQASVHESPAIPEVPSEPESSEELPAKATQSFESSRTELSDAQ